MFHPSEVSMTHLLLTLLACGPKNGASEALASPRIGGPETVEVDLIRAWPGAPKIYVEATLPDGSQGIFMVDTGASVTVVSEEVAERLNVPVTSTGGTISGLGGTTEWRQAVIPSMDIGGIQVFDVNVAVGVPGVPKYAGWIPIDGILGNNVWGNFTLAIDYPADVMEIGLPGTIPVPETAVPMHFDGNHVLIEVTLNASTPEGDVLVHTVPLELDTGARQILLSGNSGAGLEGVATEGEEPIFGIGASDLMPVSAFYQRTRHVPVISAELGGVVVDDPGPATWINYEGGPSIGPTGLRGLAGHVLLEDHRAVFDFQGGQFALTDSTHDARQADGHELMLSQDIEEFGADDAERGLVRSRYLLTLDRNEEALTHLDGFLVLHPDDPEALVYRARVLRYLGDLDGYADVVAGLDADDLVEENEIVATVNGLVLVGRYEDAIRLATEATVKQPDEPDSWLALADARLGSDDPQGAREALAEAARHVENPDAYLKRRARIAMAEGDSYAALAHLRRRLALYPSDGEALWFYAMLASTETSVVGTFEADAARAMARLHPEGRPLDFLLASYRLVGATTQTDGLMETGIERDCEQLDEEASRNNCMAWYQAMGGLHDDASLELIQSAVDAEANRPDFLDTLAMVHLVRGDFDQAAEAALLAARLNPDRFYHLWQAERIQHLADTEVIAE
jgi:tetratricopeptide (TPR) repeat protein